MQSPTDKRPEVRLRVTGFGVVEFECAFVVEPRRDRAVSR